MPDDPTIRITPSVLAWARRTAALSVTDAARRIKVAEPELLSWEDGEAAPTMAQLRKAAETYQRPLAFFFLPNPPRDFKPISEYRRHHADGEADVSRVLALAIRSARERRAFVLDVTDASPEFALRGDLSADPERLAARIRDGLAENLPNPPLDTGPEALFRSYTVAVEALGVLVFQVSRLDEEEMRGLSICEFPLPAILLNARDAPRAKLFSLLHEVAHLTLRQSGICDLSGDRPVEAFCNRVAAAVLAPRTFVESDARAIRADGNWTEPELVQLGRRYGLSAEAMLLRLVHLGLASEALYGRMQPGFQAAGARYRERMAAKRESGNPSYWNVYFRDRGLAFVRTALEAMYEDRATVRDTAAALEVKIKQLPIVEKRARARKSELH